jgi:hypothetical protein
VGPEFESLLQHDLNYPKISIKINGKPQTRVWDFFPDGPKRAAGASSMFCVLKTLVFDHGQMTQLLRSCARAVLP